MLRVFIAVCEDIPDFLCAGTNKSTTHDNRLLKAAASALVPGSNEYLETVQEIRLDHLEAAQKHISNQDILKKVQEEVNQDCDRLRSFLEAAQVKRLECYSGGGSSFSFFSFFSFSTNRATHLSFSFSLSSPPYFSHGNRIDH